ncbi:NitT/TauT family transport system substrate-binding protein [Saccharopolyspora antimicrobica]|uniref:NitT/TauT family transport system substrate-binding protein n=1 Tax=Saccharopolyspora antimicrobica TaxID=455193 RepID=A0A1I5IXD6_9PSEU|nr:ABC transporter substrate-binding protein [Saccharopolyspora antimicrobica]RKT83764.1 NitT/TauT family transport system substrate-binding protein [Saccharopolyspora antimicrobica]SFO65234.1 NitT/TauT family transport system substrate-binding protein [Saccharopolyspora antimicrobica]
MSPVHRALPRRSLLKLAGGAVTAGALLGTSGCGLLGGSQGDSGGNDLVEKQNLRVGALPINDLAPLHLAVKNGYFQEVGLNVEIVNANDGSAALASTIGGDYDITYSSYVPFFTAQASGTAPLRIVADCASATPNSTVIMTSPKTSIRKPQDLTDKKIAISGPGTITELLVKATLDAHGVDFSKAELTPVPFMNMPAALDQGRVDAAIVTEPFLTMAARNGAIPVVDTATGPLEDLPLTGYGATAKFVDEHPKTVAAFQKVMDRAVAEAQDRSKIEPLLPEFAKIDKETAAIITLLKFNSHADATRLQRVPRLMKQFGFINTDINVEEMIVTPKA